MKYIRTKEGRIIDLKNWSITKTTYVDYQTSKIEEDVCYQRTWFEYIGGDACEYREEHISHKRQVIAEADTIEELCDSEVIVWKDSTPSIWNKFLTKQEFEHLYSSFQRKKVIAIYGAIWCDKGLIYVAKINSKGEMELL